jgi:hypothetical protein
VYFPQLEVVGDISNAVRSHFALILNAAHGTTLAASHGGGPLRFQASGQSIWAQVKAPIKCRLLQIWQLSEAIPEAPKAWDLR